MTEEEYLTIERALHRSEFIAGKMIEMRGSTPRHSMLSCNATAEIGIQLRRTKRFSAFTCNLRLRTPNGAYLYPDGSVAPRPTQLHPGTDDVLVNPIMLFEVASPATDREVKFGLCRDIPALRDYLLLDQDSILAELFSKQADGSWSLRDYRGKDARIQLPDLECELHLANIYDGVFDAY